MVEREREKKASRKNGEEALIIRATKMWPLGKKYVQLAARPGAGLHPGQAGRETFH